MSDYKEQVNSLREHADLIETSIELYGPSATRLLVYDLRNAAAAIEALQSEIRESMQKCAECGENEPKRGEWVLQASGQDCKCSVCERYWIPFGDEYDYKFCPNCGAKMEVQE